MTCFVLIRHGETDWNREGRWQGQADVPLNQKGQAQAAQLAQELAASVSFDAIITSDLLRARQTAAPLAFATGLPVQVEPRLREIHQGEWQGLLVTEIEARYNHVFQLRSQDPWSVAPPGGETALQVRARVHAALDEISRQYPFGTVAIISHGFVLAVARTIQSGVDASEVWNLVLHNCTPYFLEWSA